MLTSNLLWPMFLLLFLTFFYHETLDCITTHLCVCGVGGGGVGSMFLRSHDSRVRVSVNVCVRACVRTYVRACVRVCVCVRV